MIAIKGRVFGRVQGVGFRYFTREEAISLNAEGYVKNLADGSVEFFIQGAPESMETLLEKLKSGPKLAKVEQCRYARVEPDASLSGFLVRY